MFRLLTSSTLLRRSLSRCLHGSKTAVQSQGSGYHHGHGKLKMRMPDGTNEWQAHRAAYVLWKGPVPPGKIVCHARECSNSSCICPDHLYAGTHKENTGDAMALGTMVLNYNLTGAPPRAKLTKFQVRVIRCLHRRGWTCSELASEFCMAYGTIYLLLVRRSWKNIP